MNFIEAVTAMKEGKKVRLPRFDNDTYLWINKTNQIHLNTYINQRDYGIPPHLVDATDWEVFDDDKDWTLLENVSPDGTAFDINDVVKCRDLIIKDLNHFFCAEDKTNNPLVPIINKRFGVDE